MIISNTKADGEKSGEDFWIKDYYEYSGRLSIYVRCLLNYFVNIVFIPRFEKLIATIISIDISASIILQVKSQLKAIYKENADTIIGNYKKTGKELIIEMR